MAIRIVLVFAVGIALAIATPLVPPIQIATGFEFLGTVEGKIFTTPIFGNNTSNLSYQEAISKCASAGYRIATIESAAQNAIFESHVCSSSYYWSWIDGVDIVIPDTFFSINTGKNLTYFNWVRGRPVLGKDDRNCLRISCNSIDGSKWWDVECTDKLSVICEVPV